MRIAKVIIKLFNYKLIINPKYYEKLRIFSLFITRLAFSDIQKKDFLSLLATIKMILLIIISKLIKFENKLIKNIIS